MVLRFGLSEDTIEKICSIFAQHERIEKAVIYGSRAKGNYKNGSDIDLTLYGNDIDFQELLKIMVQLDDLLLPYTIDLSIFTMLENQNLCEHITTVGLLFYKRQTFTGGIKKAHNT